MPVVEKFDMDFEELLEGAMTRADFPVKSKDLHYLFADVMEMIKKAHPEKYEKLYLKAYVLLNGWHFDKELAEYAVSKMENADPKNKKGEFWTIEETSAVAKSNGITFTNFTDADWYFTMNMMRSDYFNPELPEDDYKFYMHLTKGFLMDADTKSTSKEGGKAMRYWCKISLWNPEMHR